MKNLIIFLIMSTISGCVTNSAQSVSTNNPFAVTLNSPSINRLIPISNYKYVFIDESGSLTSMVASNGYAVANEISIDKVIEGIFLKRQILRAYPSKIDESMVNTSLLVKWGISGSRSFMTLLNSGYIQEVTVQIIDATTSKTVYTCTAEGLGNTDAEDIKNAISTCLNAM